jgi:hypothetical protein
VGLVGVAHLHPCEGGGWIGWSSQERSSPEESLGACEETCVTTFRNLNHKTQKSKTQMSLLLLFQERYNK